MNQSFLSSLNHNTRNQLIHVLLFIWRLFQVIQMGQSMRCCLTVLFDRKLHPLWPEHAQVSAKEEGWGSGLLQWLPSHSSRALPGKTRWWVMKADVCGSPPPLSHCYNMLSSHRRFSVVSDETQSLSTFLHPFLYPSSKLIICLPSLPPPPSQSISGHCYYLHWCLFDMRSRTALWCNCFYYLFTYTFYLVWYLNYIPV